MDTDGDRMDQVIYRKKTTFLKIHFSPTTPHGTTNGFQKCVYKPNADIHAKGVVLLHYLGDYEIATDFPHGKASKYYLIRFEYMHLDFSASMLSAHY